MGQLEPRAGEGVRELLRVVQEPARDRLVDRVEAQREIGGEHRGQPLLRVGGGTGHDGLGVLRDPLVGPRRTGGQLPLVAEENLEEPVAPLGGLVGPGDLDAAGDRVGALAGAESALPTQADLFERGRLGLGADVLGWAGAVGLAERVPTGDQRDGLLVVHRHAPEGFADVARRGHRVGVAVRAFGVDVDQPHLHRGERVLQVVLAGVALVAEPVGLRAPVDVLVRLPDVGAPAAEAEGRKAHRLQRDVAGQHDQVGPGDLLAVLLLDRPQQPARLVEVGVVRPAVQRREALLSGTGATAAVADPVGAGTVPGHPDHQRAVVAEVRRPPVLRGRQDLLDVAFDRGEIQAFELLGVVEVLAHRVGHGWVLREDLQVEPVRPPAGVGAALGRVGRAALDDRTTALVLGVFSNHWFGVLGHANPSDAFCAV